MGGRGNRRDLRLHAMTMRATQGINALTEKEKQTLRLIVRGHDAKSNARNRKLPVPKLHERLRDARRQFEVSNSRHAARLPFDAAGRAAGESVGEGQSGEVGV